MRSVNPMSRSPRWKKLGYNFAGLMTKDGRTITESSTVRGSVVATAQWTATSYTGRTYSDVNRSDWFYNYVMELSQQGIVGGNDDGTFLLPTVPRARARCSSFCCWQRDTRYSLLLRSTGRAVMRCTPTLWALPRRLQ